MAGDEAQIAPLYERAFRRPMGPPSSLDHWRWKYGRTPLRERMVWVALAGGRIVAHCAILSMRLATPAGVARCGLLVDVMTDAAHQRTGLYLRLMELLRLEFRARGYACLYGFPNELSRAPAVRQLGWQDRGLIPLYARAPWRGVLKLASVFRRVEGRVAGEILPLHDPADARARDALAGVLLKAAQFSGDASDWFGASILRDHRYLHWRYVEKPGFGYGFASETTAGNLTGVAVLARERRFGIVHGAILETLVKDSDRRTLARLVRSSFDSLAVAGVDIVTCLASTNTLVATLARCGFVRVPRRLFPQERGFAVRWLSPASEAACRHLSWHISWGDIDTI